MKLTYLEKFITFVVDLCKPFVYKRIQDDLKQTDARIERGHDMPEQEEVYEYLDELRESGVTNMYGAGAYVQRQFGVDESSAKTFLKGWMDQFGK